MKITMCRLERYPEDNTVALMMKGQMEVRIDQEVWREITDMLFPETGNPNVSRWDVGRFADLPPTQYPLGQWQKLTNTEIVDEEET